MAPPGEFHHVSSSADDSSTSPKKKREKKTKREKKEKRRKAKSKKTKKARAHKQGGRKAKKAKKYKTRQVSLTSSSSASSCASAGGRKLEIALARGNAAVAAHLLRKLGVNWRNSSGETALHLAARHNCPEVVCSLLPLGPCAADGVDARSDAGETPLLIAARLCRGSIALHLVHALADPCLASHAGQRPEDFDLDGLLRESEDALGAERRMEEQRLLEVVAAARQARDTAEWNSRLLYETGMEDDGRWDSHADLERGDACGPDWMAAVAEEMQGRNERRALEAELRARAKRARAAEEEETRRFAARRRRDSDDALPSGSRPPGQPALKGEATSRHEAAEAVEERRLEARAADDTLWGQFEGRLSASAQQPLAGPGLSAADIPWPSGPPHNPVHIAAGGHPAVARAQLRAALLRWHPDKLAQRIGPRLGEGDALDEALRRAAGIAQQLNRLLSEADARLRAAGPAPAPGAAAASAV